MKAFIKSVPLVAGMLLAATMFVNAQNEKPGWVVSKDVQKVANKTQYESVDKQKSMLQPVSVFTPSFVISKRMQTVGKATDSPAYTKGNVPMRGTPKWVVSKGVNRINQN